MRLLDDELVVVAGLESSEAVLVVLVVARGMPPPLLLPPVAGRAIFVGAFRPDLAAAWLASLLVVFVGVVDMPSFLLLLLESNFFFTFFVYFNVFESSLLFGLF